MKKYCYRYDPLYLFSIPAIDGCLLGLSTMQRRFDESFLLVPWNSMWNSIPNSINRNSISPFYRFLKISTLIFQKNISLDLGWLHFLFWPYSSFQTQVSAIPYIRYWEVFQYNCGWRKHLIIDIHTLNLALMNHCLPRIASRF